MPLPVIIDVSRGNWIVERAGAFATVGGIAGTGFEAYARLLHPVPVDRLGREPAPKWRGRRAVLERAHWPWAEVARRTNRQMHPLVQWRRLTGERDQLEFSDGWRLGAPPDGALDADLLAALTEHLHSTTTPDDVVVGVWDGWGSAHDYSLAFAAAIHHGPVLEYPLRRFVLLQSSLGDLAHPDWAATAGFGWLRDGGWPMPQLIWPEDHAWVVASEIDWDSTIVGGTRAVVDAVVADTRFEAFAIEEGDALHWEADVINPPPDARGDEAPRGAGPDV